MQKKLYRSIHDRKLTGVCGGLAKYINVDPTAVRAAWAIVSVFSFVGIIAYIVCTIVIPEEPSNIIDAE